MSLAEHPDRQRLAAIKRAEELEDVVRRLITWARAHERTCSNYARERVAARDTLAAEHWTEMASRVSADLQRAAEVVGE